MFTILKPSDRLIHVILLACPSYEQFMSHLRMRYVNQIDSTTVTKDNIVTLLIGSDVPGSIVSIKVDIFKRRLDTKFMVRGSESHALKNL